MTRINDLPKKERKLALKRMEQQRGFSDENELLMSAFAWEQTKEGQQYWESVCETYGVEITIEKLLGTMGVENIEVVGAKEVKPDSVVESIIDQFRDRSSVGIKKYGTTLDRKDLSKLDWIEHAKQEAMDLILYLEKLKQTL
jgi:hypothetical protein